MRAHRGAGSVLAASLLDDPALASAIWVIEPIAPPATAAVRADVVAVQAVGAVAANTSLPGVSTPSP
jgi:hypothetical protein